MSKLGRTFKIKNLKKGDVLTLRSNQTCKVVRTVECTKERCILQRFNNPKEPCPKTLILARGSEGMITLCPDHVTKVERSIDDRHLDLGENKGMVDEEVDTPGNLAIRAC